MLSRLKAWHRTPGDVRATMTTEMCTLCVHRIEAAFCTVLNVAPSFVTVVFTLFSELTSALILHAVLETAFDIAPDPHFRAVLDIFGTLEEIARRKWPFHDLVDF